MFPINSCYSGFTQHYINKPNNNNKKATPTKPIKKGFLEREWGGMNKMTNKHLS